MRDDLHAPLAIGYAIHRSLALVIGFQLQAVAKLPSIFIQLVQYHAGIAHRLGVSLLDNQEVQL
jgi:hypothetical protein